MLSPDDKRQYLLRWIGETDRATRTLPDADAETLWLSLILRVRALLAPGGVVDVELERLYQRVCECDPLATHKARTAFLAMQDAPRTELRDDFVTPSLRARKPLTATAAQQEYLVTDEQGALALAKSLYVPLDLLAHHDMPEPVRALLLLPLQALDPEHFGLRTMPDAATVASVIAAAQTVFPSLDMSPTRLDFSTPSAFVHRFNAELQLQRFDQKARARRASAGAAVVAEPDWDAMVTTIVDGAKAAIGKWHKRRGDAAYALLFEVDPPAGYVLFSFETVANHRAVRTGAEKLEAKRRADALRGPNAWREARAYLSPRLDELFNPGDFAAQDFGRVDFGEALRVFSESDACPPTPDEGEPYVSAQLRLCLWRAIEALFAERAYDPILTTPVAVGYASGDEPPVILRIVERR